MRKSIFDIAKEKLDMSSDTDRLIKMAVQEETLYFDCETYTLFEFVDEFCFSEWTYRSRYIDLNDYLKALNFKALGINAKIDVAEHLTLIELIYNLWYLAYKKLRDINFREEVQWRGNFYHMKAVMEQILEELNYTVYANESKDRFIVAENKPEVTAVAETMATSELSFAVIKYNHRSLKGDIDAKKTILVFLGAELEARRKELQKINGKLADNIFFMLNNTNIRHNNCAPTDKGKYKEYVANMSQRQLEDCYDELYQMILLGFLLLDNEERSIKIQKLRDNINGENKDGQAENAHVE